MSSSQIVSARGYLPGAWDMFHIGHLNIIARARELTDHLIVGVVADEALIEAKGRGAMVPLEERIEIVAAIDLVDEVVVDRSNDKREVWRAVGFDTLFKGDDWQGTEKGARLEARMAQVGASVHYFPYTMHTSSSSIRKILSGA